MLRTVTPAMKTKEFSTTDKKFVKPHPRETILPVLDKPSSYVLTGFLLAKLKNRKKGFVLNVDQLAVYILVVSFMCLQSNY